MLRAYFSSERVMKEGNEIPASEITAPEVYFNRRNFMRAGILAASALATGAVYRRLNRVSTATVRTRNRRTGNLRHSRGRSLRLPRCRQGHVVRGHHALQQLLRVLDQQGRRSRTPRPDFETKGWQVAVGGLVGKPKVFDLDELLKISPPEERVYRMRCVEGWSMVIPWAGFSLSKLLERVEPLSDAKYVAFETLLDPKRMPGQRNGRARLALRRGAADGRGDAPADAAGQRAVWPRLAAAGRRPDPAGRAVEVRLQGHQVDREDHAGRDPAADDVEPHAPRTSTASTPTSTRRWTIRAGARPPSSASASPAGARR